MQLPTRYTHTAEARLRFGEKVDRLGPFLLRGDPLADDAADVLAGLPTPAREALLARLLREGARADAPEALRRLFAQLDHVPFWLDRERADRGGQAFLRSGPLGGFVLGAYSLIIGYCSPAGNKPLAFTGRLQEQVPRRLAETGRFVRVVSQRGGMRRDGEGFAVTVRVRLMHAHVRRLLRVSPRWRAQDYGEPINQLDMVGTTLLFSAVVIDGLRRLGVPVSDAEAEDLLHLWRYVGYVMGVSEELLATSLPEAMAAIELIGVTQDPPDDDSRALAKALIERPLAAARSEAERARARRMVGFGYGLSRYLIGDRYADALRYPRTGWRLSLPVLRRVVAAAGGVAAKVPAWERLSYAAGLRYWDWSNDNNGLRRRPADYLPPERLRAG